MAVKFPVFLSLERDEEEGPDLCSSHFTSGERAQSSPSLTPLVVKMLMIPSFLGWIHMCLYTCYE